MEADSIHTVKPIKALKEKRKGRARDGCPVIGVSVNGPENHKATRICHPANKPVTLDAAVGPVGIDRLAAAGDQLWVALDPHSLSIS
jgi:hypothetical protein